MSVDKLFNIVSGVEYQLNILKDAINVLDKEEQKNVDEAYQRGYDDATKIISSNEQGIADKAYQRGLDDAWEAARKIALMDTETSEKVTGYFGLFRIMENLTPMQAIAKLKAYEQKQNDKIEVGDEVNWLGDCFIVTRIFQPHNMKEQCDGIDDDGCVYHDVLMDDLEKTGRHFDITSILEEMRND